MAPSAGANRTAALEGGSLATPVDGELPIFSPGMRRELEGTARRLIHGKLRRWIDPSDIVQEVQTHLLENPERVTAEMRENPNRLLAFSVRLVERRIIDAYRALKAQKRGGGREGEELTAAFVGRNAPPSAKLEAQELVDTLTDSIGKTDPSSVGRVKRVLELLGADYSSDEIGEKLGVSPRTIQRDICKVRPLILAQQERDRMP